MTKPRKSVHIVLQGKGGCGKTMMAWVIAQYFKSLGHNLHCADTDPINRTFAGYPALAAQVIKIMEGNQITVRAFDKLIETLATHEGTSVVDTGAATFVPLSGYLAENDSIALLQENGVDVCIHTVLVGGEVFEHTYQGMAALLDTMDAPLVIWENEFFGPVVNRDGRRVTESKVFENHKDRIKGIITFPKRNPDTFGQDLAQVVSQHLTFDEAQDQFGIVPRKRIQVIRDDLFAQMKAIGL